MPRIAKVLMVLLWIAGTLLLGFEAFAANLSRTEVEQFMRRMDQAARTANRQDLVECFAPDAQIKVVVDGKTLEYNRSEYIAKLQRGHEIASNHNYQSNIQSIELKQDKAMVVLKVQESVNAEGFGTFTSTTDEVALLQKVNGRLQVSQLVAKVQYKQKF